jgi:hypothetical protein
VANAGRPVSHVHNTPTPLAYSVKYVPTTLTPLFSRLTHAASTIQSNPLLLCQHHPGNPTPITHVDHWCPQGPRGHAHTDRQQGHGVVSPTIRALSQLQARSSTSLLVAYE